MDTEVMIRVLRRVLCVFMLAASIVDAQLVSARFEQLFARNGLSQSTVDSIAQNQREFIWFGTHDNSSRYDGFKFAIYRHGPADQSSLGHDDVPDGLFLSEFSSGVYCRSLDGRISFSSAEGFALDPAEVQLSLHPPSVALMSFPAFGESLRVSPRSANSDGTWSDGTWNEDASTRVVIALALWQRWWFRLLVAGLAVALIAGILIMFRRYQIHRLMEVERMRRRIADDLHDDIGSKMSVIALMMDLASRNARLTESERRHLAKAAREARQIVDDLRDTVWLIDTGRDHLSDLILRMEKTARQMLQGRPHRFTWPDEVPSIMLSMEVRRHILMIFKEALHNALRHSRASLIEVRVAVDKGALQVCIIDDGRGFDEQEVETGRGLSTMHKRARCIGGDLNIQSWPGQGTTVAFGVKTV